MNILKEIICRQDKYINEIDRKDKYPQVKYDGGTQCILVKMCLLLMSSTYMMPWTSLGALIPYFQQVYGERFYIKISSAFYLPGLPFAILELVYGERFDVFLSSRHSYLLRGVLSYLLLIILLISFLWVDNESTVLASFAIIGTCTWILHGSATTIATMFHHSYVLYLQVGFRIPEVYAVLMVISLSLSEHYKLSHLYIFYGITAGVLSIGLVAWIILVKSDSCTDKLEMKDNKALFFINNADESKPLLQTFNMRQSLDKSDKAQATRLVSSYVSIFHQVKPLCFTLFLTLLSSILSSAFFVYVKSPNNYDIAQTLYFIRLFCDLFGRPLTTLPRPQIVQTMEGLLMVAFIRVGLMGAFFLYILFYSTFQSDFVITIICILSSLLSGYLVVVTYEVAIKEVRENGEASVAYAGSLLNLSFQLGSFVAVIFALSLSQLDYFKTIAVY